MSLTRRELVRMTASGVALVPLRVLEAKEGGGVSLLLDGGDCLTRESAAGYRRLLNKVGLRAEVASGVKAINFHTILLPAIGALTLPTALALREKVEAGHLLILESALAFADVQETESQRAVIAKVFGLRVELTSPPPVERVSYLRYRWPADVLVRHFGNPATVSGARCQSIAQLGSLTVAAMKPIGLGKIIFLGTPIGPMLMAGDREAALLARQMLSGIA